MGVEVKKLFIDQNRFYIKIIIKDGRGPYRYVIDDRIVYEPEKLLFTSDRKYKLIVTDADGTILDIVF